VILRLQTFFLWPHFKNSIYQTPVHDLQELKLRITEKVNEITNNPGRYVAKCHLYS
jgi:hypothetical protein